MVSTSPSEPMTMPEPSRSIPRFCTVRPSGLMNALTRTTAAARSSTETAWAWAEATLAKRASIAISVASTPPVIAAARRASPDLAAARSVPRKDPVMGAGG